MNVTRRPSVASHQPSFQSSAYENTLQNASKIFSKPLKILPKTLMPYMIPKCPWNCSNCPNILPKYSQNCSKMEPKLVQKSPKNRLKLLQNDLFQKYPKNIQIFSVLGSQNGAPNRPKILPKTILKSYEKNDDFSIEKTPPKPPRIGPQIVPK